MYNVKKIQEDLFWVGVNERRLALFENVYPVPKGVSYNSYVLLDNKTVLFDTVERSESAQFIENLKHVLDGKKLDYVVVNHMEPDHCATLEEIVRLYPEIKVVCNIKTVNMIKQFFNFDIDSRKHLVKNGDILETGKHKLTFVEAPMVHWPEVMVTYDLTDKILFSADAFGTFGAVDGNLFADEVDFDADYMDEARRYYTNIVGKYGPQVTNLLNKASELEIKMVCPLHGFVWRHNINHFIDKYVKWATYTPEENTVLIVYGSIYGGTRTAAEILAGKLAEKGLKNIRMFDVSVTHFSYLIAEAFRCSHIVFASTTYNAGVFVNMENFINVYAAHSIKNRTVAFIENGTWMPTSAKLMAQIVSSVPSTTVIENTLTIKSALKENQMESIGALADAIYESMPKPKKTDESKTDNTAFYNIEYGIFVLSAKDGNKDNGCIINTLEQVTDSPKRVSVTVNKSNYTHDIIMKTKEFNVSILTKETDFPLIKRFGFACGKDTDKFSGFENAKRSENGIYYIDETTNAFISGKVITTVDLGTHTIFIADVVESKTLSNVESLTYRYYLNNIKPKPNMTAQKKKGYVCKICGFVYEGDTLPDDYICPICKHGVEAFEKIE